MDPSLQYEKASLEVQEQDAASLTCLPPAVLATVLTYLTSPVDVARVASTCHYLRIVALSAPLKLVIRPLLDSKEPLEDSFTRAVYSVRAQLAGIRRSLCGTQELDVSGCPISDEDVASLLADLKCLETLVTDGCQKLTSAVADTLAVSVSSGPRSVSLQRCFRLGPAPACNLLAAAGAQGSKLQCVLLSHLDRLDLPRDEHGDDITPEPTLAKDLFSRNAVGTGLRILALNNCGSLASSELASVAATCPLLELLFLGGSGEGLGLCRPETCSSDQIELPATHLTNTVAALPHLKVLELTFFGSALVAAVKQEVQDQVGSRSDPLHVWDLCTAPSVADAVLLVKGQTFEAREVGYLQRHDLKPKEEAPLSADAIFGIRAAANCSDLRRRTPLHVAALKGQAGTVAGLVALGASAGGFSGEGPRDSGGATALFLAAESGHTSAVSVLCKAGADVLAANRAGESPLYIAALRGHCDAVQVMLDHCNRAGVDWQAASAYGDGWTPLMAAAVADRQDVARVLLQAAGAQSSRSPETVEEPGGCNRLPDVSSLVLGGSTGGPAGSTRVPPGSDSVPAGGGALPGGGQVGYEEDSADRGVTGGSSQGLALLDAQNRYSQTALHVAARRASVWFVVNLLSAGASPHVRDAYGMRPVDVALRQRHSVIVEILRAWDAPAPVSTPVVGSSKSAESTAKLTGSNANLKKLKAPRPLSPPRGDNLSNRGKGKAKSEVETSSSRGQSLLNSLRRKKAGGQASGSSGSERRNGKGMRVVWAKKQGPPSERASGSTQGNDGVQGEPAS